MVDGQKTEGQVRRLKVIKDLRSRFARLEKRWLALCHQGGRDSDLLDENILVFEELKALVREYRGLYHEAPK